MRKRAEQLVAWYLALCLALAGVVGLSPALHRLIEHGGHGPAHIHAAGAQRELSHHHGEGHSHEHFVPSSSIAVQKLKHQFTHRHEFTLATLPVRALLQLASELLASDAADSNSKEKAPSHHHDSLSQLVASGLIDQHFECDLLNAVYCSILASVDAVDARLLVRDLDPQASPRAPPVERHRLV
jgi:hypothetical protein